jgi:hypothetical protein
MTVSCFPDMAQKMIVGGPKSVMGSSPTVGNADDICCPEEQGIDARAPSL